LEEVPAFEHRRTGGYAETDNKFLVNAAHVAPGDGMNRQTH
jgi:hypothetical protein